MSEQRKRRPAPQSLPAVQRYEEDTMEIDLEELLFRLLGRWKLILCLSLSLALIVGGYTHFFITPTYEATATIYVLSRRDSAINMSDLQIGTALTADYIKVFKMWEVHEEVISNLNLPYSYKEMQNMLSVANDSNTRMLDITIASADPQEAAAIANEYAKVVSHYIADTMSTDKPSIMSVALVPSNPVGPSVARHAVIGMLAGFMLACGIVFVNMLMDDKYKTAEDIRRYTGLVTLAAIPLEEQAARKMGKKRDEEGDAP